MTDTRSAPQVGKRLDEDRRRTDTREKVAALHAQGVKPRTIALELGISTQQVYRHLQAIREAS